MKISEHFKDGRVVGYKKFIHGRNFHLTTGTSPSHHQFAIAYAKALTEAAESLSKTGGQWTDALIEQCRSSATAQTPQFQVTPLPNPVPQQDSTPSIKVGKAVEKFLAAEWLRVQFRRNTVFRVHTWTIVPIAPVVSDFMQKDAESNLGWEVHAHHDASFRDQCAVAWLVLPTTCGRPEEGGVGAVAEILPSIKDRRGGCTKGVHCMAAWEGSKIEGFQRLHPQATPAYCARLPGGDRYDDPRPAELIAYPVYNVLVFLIPRETLMLRTILLLLILMVVVAGFGCTTTETAKTTTATTTQPETQPSEAKGFDIYIESWDRIAFNSPCIVEKNALVTCSDLRL